MCCSKSSSAIEIISSRTRKPGHKSVTTSRTVAKRNNESVHQAYARIVNNNIEIRSALLKSNVPNMMSTKPVVHEVIGHLTADDTHKAYLQLVALAEKQHKTFEQVFSDPENGELARGTYTGAMRPTTSSTSGSDLQRR
jgi:hypothetical protein